MDRVVQSIAARACAPTAVDTQIAMTIAKVKMAWKKRCRWWSLEWRPMAIISEKSSVWAPLGSMAWGGHLSSVFLPRDRLEQSFLLRVVHRRLVGVLTQPGVDREV